MPGLVPPLVMVGVLVVLLPVFTLMTLDRVKKQDEFIRDQFLVKGTALIRTFEAGTRTGMLTMQWGIQRIQAMLEETAVQPDVSYIMITDEVGKIIAHSDATQIGETYDGWSGLPPMPPDPHQVFSRSLTMESGPVLEVAKRFVPFKSEFGKGHKPGHGKRHMDKWKSKKFGPHKPDHRFFQLNNHFIFTGLSMSKVEEIQHRVFRNIIGRGVGFFILGCAGIISLFAFQAYRSAKASLNRVKAFSDNVVQNMPSGLVTLDTAFHVTSANKAARDILGNIPDTGYPQMVALTSQIAGNQKPVSKEVVLRPNDEKELRLDMTASSIVGEEDETQGFVFLFRDLTQLKELKKEVETNRRLAAIGKLAGGVAHEIRNPLSSIKGFATYFAKRYENEPDDVDTARIMVQEVERINRSINQLLEFAKPMAVEIKPVEIESLIRHSLKLISHDLEKQGIEAEVQTRTGRKRILSDPERITQVLLNLYMNAINAITENGKIQVSVDDMPTGIEISVSDNGCGIAPESMEEIFDPYFTTRPEGTGLGLSIVHRIVENLKGEICVESEPGKGTRFIVMLPATDLAGSDNIRDEKED